MDMMRSSVNRIRKLQQACTGDSFSALLFIGGVDGRYSYGSTAALGWLFLGNSGTSISRYSIGNIEGNTANWGPTEAHEMMDETFVLITANQVLVFYDEEAESLMKPHLSFWASCDVGLVVASGSEERKVFEFKSGVLEYLNQGDVVGIPLPSGAVDSTEIERWPLVSSFAVELENSSFGQTGFFTMRHPIVDVCGILEDEFFSKVDALLVQKSANSVLSSFREHWKLTANTIRQTNRDSLNELTCVEQLSILFDSCISYPMKCHHLPRALMGERSEAISEGVSETDPVLTQTKQSDLHLVIESSDAISGATVCRTFFLTTGKTSHGGSEQNACSLLMTQYLSLVEATKKALDGTMFDLTQYQTQIESRIHQEVSGDLKVSVELFDGFGSRLKTMGSSDLCVFAYVKASLHDLQFGGQHIGAVAVGNTYVFSKQHSPSQVSSRPLTTGVCAPYCAAITGAEPYEARLNRDINTSLRNHTSVGGVCLGMLKETIASECLLVLESQEVGWSHLFGHLKVYEKGFALTDTGLAPFLVSFEHHLRGVKIVDHPAGSMLLLAFIDDTTSESASDEKTDDKLRPEAILPLTRQLRYAGLVLPAESRPFTSVMNMLSEWRMFAMRVDVALSQDFEASDSLMQLSVELCLDLIPEFKLNLTNHCADGDASSTLACYDTSCGSSNKQDTKQGVSILIGHHGSGVLDVYSSLLNFCPDETVIKSLLDFPTTSDQVHNAVQKLLKRATDSPRERLVLALVTDLSVVRVSAVIESTVNAHITSITGCVNAASIKEKVGGSSFTRFNSAVLDLTASGWVSTIFALDASSSQSNGECTEKFRRQLREINPNCMLALTSRGYLNSEGVHSILEPLNHFQQEVMRSNRELHLCQGWERLDLHAGTTKASNLPVSFTVQFPGEISSIRLQLILSKLYPHATVRMPPKTLSENEPAPPSRSIGMRRLWELAQYGKTQELAHSARVKEIEKQTQELGALTSSFNGQVTLGGYAVAIEGSPSAISVVFIEGETYESSYLTFTSSSSSQKDTSSSSLNEDLRQLLLLSVGKAPAFTPLRTRKSLSHAEVDLVIRNSVSIPLPEGWLFDGNNYVNFDGRRLSQRPDKETLLQDWIQQENTRISSWCSPPSN